MATIATMQIELLANVARLRQDMDEAKRTVRSATDSMSSAFSTLQAALGGLTLAGFAHGVMTETVNAERSANRLTAGINALQASAGLARAELDDMANSLAELTEFDDDSIRDAQATFLKFGNIHDDVFRRGIKTAADYASFTGTTIPEAAQLIGKALASPTEGMATLERQIGKLTTAQETQIRSLVEQGRGMQAQMAVLDILNSRIGGTAELMNSKLVGATTTVKKNWDDLMESIGKTDTVGGRAERALGGLGALLKDMQNIIDGTDERLDRLLKNAAAARAFADGSGPAVGADGRIIGGGRFGRRGAGQPGAAGVPSAPDTYLNSFDSGAMSAAMRGAPVLGGNTDSAAIKAAAEKAKKDIDEMLKRGTLSAEEAARARHDIAQEAAAAEAQVYLRQLKERIKEEEDMVERAQKGAEQAQINAYNEANDAYIAQGQEANRQRLEMLKKEKDEEGQLVRDMIQAFEGWGRSASKEIADMVMDSEYGFDRIRASARNLLRDIIAMQINKRMVQPIIGAATGGIDSVLGGIEKFFGFGKDAPVARDTTAMLNSDPMEFASGGRFTVGGNGGQDNVPVRFMATAGERVSIETPAQQSAADSRDWAGATPTIHQTIHVGGNVTEADLPRIIEAARQGAIAGVMDLQSRGAMA